MKHKYRAWDGIQMTTSGIQFSSTTGELTFIPKGELLRYSGFEDTNDIEIYAGDKIEFCTFDYNGHDTQYVGYVVDCGSRFMIWKTPDSEFFGSDGGFELDFIMSQDDSVEIIGNIYENPELIEV